MSNIQDTATDTPKSESSADSDAERKKRDAIKKKIAQREAFRKAEKRERRTWTTLAAIVAIGLVAAASVGLYYMLKPTERELRERELREAEKREKQLEEIAKEIVKLRLKDPYSAMFSGFRQVRVGEKLYLCGLVNSKNAMGGYTGHKGYAIIDGIAFFKSDMKDMDNPNMNKTIEALVACRVDMRSD